MADPYVGQILAVGFSFTPEGWLARNGQQIPISQYDVLYALIGTTYGGDGVSTFAVPDLRGRTAIGAGQGPHTPSYSLGQSAGSETVTLLSQHIGAHRHQFLTSPMDGTVNVPDATHALAVNTQVAASVYTDPPPDVPLSGTAISISGDGAPHDNMQPYLVVNYIICYQGTFPTQG